MNAPAGWNLLQRALLFLACCTVLAAPASLYAVEVVALRGASHEAPENSLPAIELAWKQKTDAVMVNLQITKDLQLVLMHDIYPKAAEKNTGPVSRLTHTQLKKLDIGKPKGEKWAGTRIPAFGEVWSTLPETGRLFLVIETGNYIHKATANVLEKKSKLKDRVVVMSPFVKNLLEVKKRLPDMTTLWMTELEESRTGTWTPRPETFVSQLNKDGLDGIFLMDCPGVDKNLVSALHAAKKKVYVWGTNDEEAVKRLRKIGVDGIASTRPQWLREILETPEPSETAHLDPPVMKTAIRGLNLGELKKTVVAKFEASKHKHGELDTHGLFYEAHYLAGCLTNDKTVKDIRVRYAQGRLKLIQVSFQPEINLKALEKRLSKDKDLTFLERKEKDVGNPKRRTEIFVHYKNATFDQPVDVYINCSRIYQYDHDRLTGSELSEPVLMYDYTPLKTH